MFMSPLRLPLIIVALLLVGPERIWALGEILGETKEELKLSYEVSVYDHGTGRVTATLTIADEGRLAPLDAVELCIRPRRSRKMAGSSWTLSCR